MFRPRVIPVLLLKDLGLVKTNRFNKSKYIGDPINAVKIFNDLKADEIIFLDISATATQKSVPINFVWEVGEEAFMPFAVGGGISTLLHAEECIKKGAEKIVLDTHAIINHSLISECSNMFGQQSVIVAIDIKKNIFGGYSVYSNNGKTKTNLTPVNWAKRAEELGAGEILINDINNDGMMDGYNLDLIKIISEAVSIPVIACGGAGKLNDFKLAINSGAHAVAAGSLFVYQGSRKGVLINYPSHQQLMKVFND